MANISYLKANVIKWVLILGVIPVLLIFSIYALDQNDFFLIDKINVVVNTTDGQKSFSKVYVERLLEDLKGFKNKSLLNLPLGQVAQFLRNEKWIKEFRVSRDWPSKLKIAVKPHTISFLLTNPKNLGEGLFAPVTDQAEILEQIDSHQAPALAMLTGESFKKNIDKRKKAIELLDALPADGKISYHKISEVSFDTQGGYWIKLIDSNTKIKLGEDNFALKAARVSQVLDYLDKKDLKARVIDANLSKKVLVRLHPKAMATSTSSGVDTEIK